MGVLAPKTYDTIARYFGKIRINEATRFSKFESTATALLLTRLFSSHVLNYFFAKKCITRLC